MKKRCMIVSAIIMSLFTGCGTAKADNSSETIVNTTQSYTTAAATETVLATTQPQTSVTTDTASETTALTTQNEDILTEAETVTEAVTETAAEEPASTEVTTAAKEIFTGILIDEDCSDFDDPPKHDLPCMLMDSCRASGYGIDIEQADGGRKFYMFDENGQELSWDYLTHTDRMDGLYVTVTGILANDIIYVDKLEEK